jgi:L-lysine 2,3-aminomutase
LIHSAIEKAAEDWQSQLRNVITSRDELLNAVNLRLEDVGSAGEACQDFPLKVPRSFVSRMRCADPQDPLLLQVLSLNREMTDNAGYTMDPLQEAGHIPHRGIIHKYNGRVLLIASGGCAVNCRYCFRRHFPYSDNRNSRYEWHEALDYIRNDKSIEEVILSGGDPLVMDDAQLTELTNRIADIAHVKRLRIHSRLPIVIPDRVTAGLLDAIRPQNVQTVMVLHCNHANEIDEHVTEAIFALRRRDVSVLNQAVLLRGINDNVLAQIALSQSLFSAGVLPYYLHMLDKVKGAAHFDVGEAEAQVMMQELRAQLPGYMVPKLVREISGGRAKSPV